MNITKFTKNKENKTGEAHTIGLYIILINVNNLSVKDMFNYDYIIG